MKRSVSFLLVALVLICSLLLISCSSSPSSTTTTSAPPSTSATQTTTSSPAQTTTSAPALTTTQAPAPATTLTSTTTTKPAVARPAPSGTLNVADNDFGYESFDPIFYESFWGWAMYDPLLSWDAKGNIIGSVAESYNLSPDGKTWTFKIRKGIKFSNGDPLTAQDVAFSVQRFAGLLGETSSNPWSPYLARNFAGISVPDDYTFIYKAINPEPALVIPFAWTRILPKNYLQSHGTDYFRAHPIGSGPWIMTKFVSKTEVDFDANTAYWNPNGVPFYAHIHEILVPEEATRIAMLKRGDVDIIYAISTDRLLELQAGGFALRTSGANTLANINFQGTWLTTGPTQDKNIRMAMSYALNRDEICKTFYKGLAIPGGRWEMDPSTYGWDPSWKPDPYDPAQVKTLLAAAGYPSKYKNPVITLIAQTGPMADLMQVCKGYWDTAGIQTQIKIVDAMTYGGLFFVRNNDPKGANVGDVVNWIYSGFFNTIYHCANMYTSVGVHSTGNDPQADALYTQATTELDPVKALAEWTAFQNYAYSMWVDVGICYQPSYFVTGPNITGFTDQSWKSLTEAYAGITHK